MSYGTEEKIRRNVWGSHYALEAIERDYFPDGIKSLEVMKKAQEYSLHFNFITQIAHEEHDRKLLSVIARHVARQASYFGQWDGGANIRSSWVQLRDTVVDAMSDSDVFEWAGAHLFIPGSLTSGITSDPDDVRDNIRRYADDYLDKVLLHVQK